MTNYSNIPMSSTDLQPVLIMAVNTDTLVADVATRGNTQISVSLSYQVGNILSIPAVGEQWIMERVFNDWRLVSRLPYQDPKLNGVMYPGITHIGSNAPTVVHGEALVINSGALVLGEIGKDESVTLSVDPTGNLVTYGNGRTGRVGPRSATTPRSVYLSHTPHNAQRLAGVSVSNVDGFPVGAMHGTKVVYVFGTKDVSGSTTVRLLRNGSVIPGSTLTVPAASQELAANHPADRTAAIDVDFAETDLVSVEITATPGAGQMGNRLIAILTGTVTANLVW